MSAREPYANYGFFYDKQQKKKMKWNGMFKWAKNMIIWGEGGIVVHDPCAYYTHIVSGIFFKFTT